MKKQIEYITNKLNNLRNSLEEGCPDPTHVYSVVPLCNEVLALIEANNGLSLGELRMLHDTETNTIKRVLFQKLIDIYPR